MSGVKDLTGRRFERLVVMNFSGLSKHRHSIWKCMCDCGDIVEVIRPSLIGGKTKSCGCLHNEQSSKNGKSGGTHLMSFTKTYWTWSAMIQRCTNEKSESYINYGGRGVKVCTRWLESFENFLTDMGEKPVGMQLDRKDNENGYEPSNCRWVSPEVNANNRRSSILFKVAGETLSISQLARKFEIKDSVFRYQINKGLNIKDALAHLNATP